MRYFSSFMYWVFQIQPIFYTYSTSQFELTRFQMFSGRMWLVVIILDIEALALCSSSSQPFWH